MKYIVTILLFFIAFNSIGQTVQINQKDSTVFKPSTFPGAVVAVKPGVFHADTLQIVPRDTIWHPLRTGTITTPNGLDIYLWDGAKWNGISGNGNIRDTAYLSQGFGVQFINNINPEDSLYKPNGNDIVLFADTAALRNYFNNFYNNSTTIQTSGATIVDSIANAPTGTEVNGTIYLVGTSPTGAFAGKADNIAELIGGVWNFTPPVAQQQLIVNDVDYATYQYNASIPAWVQTAVLWLVGGNRNLGSNAFAGRTDDEPYNIRSGNKLVAVFDTARDLILPKWAGLEDSNVYLRPSLNGKVDTGYFRQLIAGTGITLTAGLNRTDTISSTGGVGSETMQQTYDNSYLIGGFPTISGHSINPFYMDSLTGFGFYSHVGIEHTTIQSDLFESGSQLLLKVDDFIGSGSYSQLVMQQDTASGAIIGMQAAHGGSVNAFNVGSENSKFFYNDADGNVAHPKIIVDNFDTSQTTTPYIVGLIRGYNLDGTPSDTLTAIPYPSGGGGSETWQQTLINGSDLTQNNYSAFDNNSFVMQGINTDGGETDMSIYNNPGAESISFNAGGGGSGHFFLDGYNTHGWKLTGFPGGDTSRVEVDGNGSTGTVYIKADTIDINNAYKIPVVDGTAGQVLTTNGSGVASWQDGGGGGSSLFPTNGLAIATGDVTGDLSGHHLLVTNSGNTFLDINGIIGSENSYLQSNDGIGFGFDGLFTSISQGYSFGLDVSNGVNEISIVGDAAANTITQTAGTNIISDNLTLSTFGSGTHTGTATYGLSVDASGNVIETTGGGGSSPAGNYGNLQLNRNSAFATPASDSLSFNSAVLNIKGGLSATGTITATNATAIVNAVNNTTGLNASFGTFGIQSYATNNGWFGDNLSYDGGSFKYTANGFGTLCYFAGGNFNIYTAVSGTAGAAATIAQQFQVGNTGVIKFSQYGAGTITADASGYLSSLSDERLKNIQGYYKTGLKELMNINPIVYKWNKLSGNEMDSTYAGFSAQNVKANIPYGTGQNKDGYLSLQDRAIMATLVNSIKEQQKEIEDLREEINKLKGNK